MTLKVRYRGKIDNLLMIRDFEDRVLKITSAFGSRVSLWRSDADSSRCQLIRGLVIHLCPGQSPVNLLLDADGQLIEMRDLNKSVDFRRTWPRWCAVHTAFSGADGHTAVIELLTLMKAEWFSQLQVLDLSGYWEHRDPLRLECHIAQRISADILESRLPLPGTLSSTVVSEVSDVVHQLTDSFSAIARRIGGRVRPGERVTSDFRHDAENSFSASVRDAEEFLLQQRIENEQLLRSSAEADLCSDEEALLFSMANSESLLRELPEDARKHSGASEIHWSQVENSGTCDPDVLQAEGPDSRSLHPSVTGGSCDSGQDSQSPLLREACALSIEFLQSCNGEVSAEGFSLVLHNGLLDLVGGLACGESIVRRKISDRYSHCEAVVQLRLALRATCFAAGALVGLHANGQINRVTKTQWQSRLQNLHHQTYHLLTLAWKTGERAA
jgi:hypothetical protein